jgi:hypothetical protein
MDEAEFVRRSCQEGLLVRPRYAAGRTDVITGYSVAERPRMGEEGSKGKTLECGGLDR